MQPSFRTLLASLIAMSVIGAAVSAQSGDLSGSRPDGPAFFRSQSRCGDAEIFGARVGTGQDREISVERFSAGFESIRSTGICASLHLERPSTE